MPQSIVDSLLALFAILCPYEAGTNEAYIVAGSMLGVAVLMARILTGVFGNSKGIVVAAIAVTLPVLLAVTGYVLVELYALPKINADWAPLYLPWAGFGLVLLLAIIFISAKLLETGMATALILIILAIASGVCAQYAAQFALRLLDAGEAQVEKRDERLNF